MEVKGNSTIETFETLVLYFRFDFKCEFLFNLFLTQSKFYCVIELRLVHSHSHQLIKNEMKNVFIIGAKLGLVRPLARNI